MSALECIAQDVGDRAVLGPCLFPLGHKGAHSWAEGGADPEVLIRRECAKLADFLAEKNRRYGNSVLDPVRIFSKASPEEQLFVRIDDKLSRLRAAVPGESEDVILDLLGYLLLLRVQRRMVLP